MHYTFFPGARFCVQNDMTISSVIKKNEFTMINLTTVGSPKKGKIIFSSYQ